MKRFISYIIMVSACIINFNSYADDKVAVKTNLLYDALLNVGLGVEFNTAPHWSIDISGSYNAWKVYGGRQWKHWLVQPEARYWLRENMHGHFFSANLFGGQFNTIRKEARRQGWGLGAGIGYGYAWRIGSRLGIEAEIGVGYARYAYDRYPCSQCGRKTGHRNRNYIGPTKAALNLVYYFGRPAKVLPPPVVPDMPVMATDPATEADTVPEFEFILVDVPRGKIISDNISGIARVHFSVNKTDIDRTIADNASELDGISAILDSIRNDLDMQIVSVKFTGYASPEGRFANNDRLARERTAALKEYIMSVRDLPDSIITTDHVAEDWAGLRDAVLHSEADDKTLLLSIIDSDLRADAKEAAMKKQRSSWAWISSEVLPGLRRTEYKIHYEHRYEENETITLDEVNKAIAAGDAAKAATLLVGVPSSPEADYARGIVAALQHRYPEAEAWFVRAASRGVNAADNALRQLRTKINTIHK